MNRKNLILMFMATIICIGSLAGSAFALSAPASSETPGQALVFGYYDARSEADGGAGLTDNYFAVINTVDEYVQAHVRVRTGQRSVELLDFDVVLTPNDVFGFDVYQVNGNIVFASCDTHTLLQSGFDPNFNNDGNAATGDAEGDDCYIVNSDSSSPFYFANLTSLIKECTGETEEDAIKQTLKGYVEVIGECEMQVDSDDDAPCDKAPVAGTTCYAWDQAGCSIGWTGNLIGKVYYADTDNQWPASISRLADLNAYSITYLTNDYILHKDDYPSELANPTGPGYAYDKSGLTPDGAADMNMCFYDATDQDPVTAGIQPPINRVGAAATFGPTLADFGTWPWPASIGRMDRGFPVSWKATVAQVDALGNDIWSGVRNGSTWCMSAGASFECYNNTVDWAASHFFNFPPRMVSSFVFTFPTKHFIEQSVQARELSAFDTDENDCIIPPGKFISPGLPGQPTFAQEVSISRPTSCPSFAEGWRAYGLLVNIDGVGDQPAFFDYFNDGGLDDRNISVTGYAPLAIPFIMTSGDDVFSTSPMSRYSGSGVYWDDNAAIVP